MIRMIRGFFTYWSDEVAHNWLLVLPIVAFIVSVGMNMATGYKLAGWALCAVLFAVAIFTTYAGTVGPRGRGAAAAWLLAFLPVGLVVDQIAVWQSLGISMADGQVVRAREAASGETLTEKLERARAERAALGTQRPVAAVAAEEKLECSRTSRRYPDGEGPKCTALKAERAAAERAVLLDEAIMPQLRSALAEAPATAGGAPQYEIPILFAQTALDAVYGAGKVQVTAGNIQTGVMVLLAVVISFLANLGFWLVGFDPGAGSDGGRLVRDAGAARGRGPGSYSGGFPPGGGQPMPLFDGVPIDLGVPAIAGQLRDERPPRSALAYDGHNPATAHAHGAPISIYLSQPAPSGVGPAAQANPPAELQQDGRPDRACARSDNNMRSVPATPDAPPVDRTRVANDIGEDEREAADVIASFAAACLEPTAGGIVSARDVYQRYSLWASGKAVAEVAFLDLLQRTTGWSAKPIGGIAHLRGVALRMGEPRLEVVA